MPKYLKQLLEQKNSLITRAEEVVNKAKAETRALTEEEQKAFESIEADAKSITATIEAVKAVEGMEKKELKEEEKPAGEEAQKDTDVRAFAAQIRGFYYGETRADFTKSDNPNIVPDSIQKDIATAIRERSSLLANAEIFNGTGTISLPYYDTTDGSINVGYVNEMTAPTADAGAINTIQLGSFMIKAITKVSEEVINDTDVNLVNFVINQMADDIDFFVEGELLSEDDTNIVGLANIPDAQTVTTASATAITADEVIKAQRKVKGKFKANARWYMSSDVLEVVETLKDGNDRYLFNNDIANGFGERILGKPVELTDNMPGFESGKGIIYYGDPKGLAVHMSQELGIKVLNERYADEFAIGIRGSIGLDAKLRHAQSFAKIVLKSA